MGRSRGLAGDPGIPGSESELQITDFLLKEISRRATFSSFHFRLRYNLEVMRLKNFQKFQNFSTTAVGCGLTDVSNLFFHRLFSRYER